jgi:hypothetical protein
MFLIYYIYGKVLSSFQLSMIDGVIMKHLGMNKGNGMMGIKYEWNNNVNSKNIYKRSYYASKKRSFF